MTEEELYSSFPEDTSNEDIFEMMLIWKISAICCKCGELNIIESDDDIFDCNKCKTKQLIPTLNPEEFNKRI